MSNSGMSVKCRFHKRLLLQDKQLKCKICSSIITLKDFIEQLIIKREKYGQSSNKESQFQQPRRA